MRWKIPLLILIFSTLSLGNEGKPSPDILVLPESVDFGEVEKGEKVSTKLEVRNVGEEKLLIKRVRTSCGCTAALLSSDVIEPEGKAEIEVSFRSRREGHFRHYVSIESNDPDEPVKRVVIEGDVIGGPSLEISISPAYWDPIHLKKGSTHRFQIKNLGRWSIDLMGAKAPENLSVSLPSGRLEPGQETTVSVEALKGDGEEGKILLRIEIPISVKTE
jgi:hypothetical protein